MSDDVDEDPHERRERILATLYKDAPYMRPPEPRPPALPAARGTISHGTVRAIAQGFAPVIRDHVAAVVAAGIQPLVDRLAELEARVAELEREQAESRARPHLRVV